MKYISLVSLLLAACGPAATHAEAPLELASTSQQPVLYGTAWCPYCKAARSWFKTNNIAYIDCDVEKDQRCQQQFAALRRKYNELGVPTFLYKGKVWRGYDEGQMADMVAVKQ
jgi:glutaredoxin